MHVNQADEMVMVEICHKCLAEKTVPCSQDLFCLDEKAVAAYVVVSGTLRFSIDPKVGHLCEIHPNDWISEVVLWLDWTHRGFLNAATNSELVVVNTSRFHAIAQILPTLYWAFREYARLYRERLVSDVIMWDVWFNAAVCEELTKSAFETVAAVMVPAISSTPSVASGSIPGQRAFENFSAEV